MKWRIRVGVIVLSVAAGLAFLWNWNAGEEAKDEGAERPQSPKRLLTTPEKPVEAARVVDQEDDADDESTPSVQLTPEEIQAGDEAKYVRAFEDLTDKWLNPSKSGVSLSDIGHFKEVFRAIPKARREESIHRALNLLPDENVMLLAGILMDKTMDSEILETIYNDILNRDESVKRPILNEIYKDKTHPCWTDTAWIMDVTGQLPENK